MKQIKNRFAALLLSAAALLPVLIFMTACGGNHTASNTKAADVNRIYEELIAAGEFSEMTEVPERDLFEVYGIKTDKLRQWAFYMSENPSVNADEIAIFEVSDSEYAAELEELLNNRLKRQKGIAASYSAPAEYEKIKPSEVCRAGNYVYYVVGNGYNDLIKILKSNIG